MGSTLSITSRENNRRLGRGSFRKRTRCRKYLQQRVGET